MLLTRLQRPQFLSPAWKTALQLRHNSRGESRSVSSSSSTSSEEKPQQLKIIRERQKTKRFKPPQSKSQAQSSTLFEELFPNAARKTPDQSVKPKESSFPGKPKQPHIFEWANLSKWKPIDRETKDVFSPTGTNLSVDPSVPDYHKMRERRDASVLVLSNASKNLAESDFLRLSPKGEHIEGWTSGIIKGTTFLPNISLTDSNYE